MRRASIFLILTIATIASAQERRPPARPIPSFLLGPTIDRMDTEIRGKTAGVRRDAFIVSQIVAAVGELDEVRRDRHTLSDLQARLSSMTNDIDNALADALGATFDYFRAGQ